MQHVLEGKAPANVPREHRTRTARGATKVTPFDEAVSVEVGKDVAVEDSKAVEPTDTKSPKTIKKSKK